MNRPRVVILGGGFGGVYTWTLDLFFTKDIVQFQTSRSGGISEAPHLEPGEDPSLEYAPADAKPL
jgi:hypothetical protein